VDVGEYQGWAFDDAEAARDAPATAEWSYLNRSVTNCRICRHRWTRVDSVRPHRQRI
jgi:hypothetical protein